MPGVRTVASSPANQPVEYTQSATSALAITPDLAGGAWERLSALQTVS